jgi:Ca2+-binding RTX toxin-like protein
MFGRLFSTNRIYGAAGNDLITGGTVNDSRAGGSGNDLLLARPAMTSWRAMMAPTR